jgi:hypothetical protein
MKTVITIPVWLHDFKKEDLIAEVERREKYAFVRDLQAEEFNRAIVSRLSKDKEIVSRLAKDREIVSISNFKNMQSVTNYCVYSDHRIYNLGYY